MAYLDFVGALHNRTKRDYRQRVIDDDKAECATVAKQFGADYWDGDRRYGYGGYRYDGRWFPVAAAIAKHYGLRPGQRVLDIGCGKGYLLHELTRAVPGIEIAGIDISEYAIDHAKEEVKPFLQVGGADKLPYPDRHFDLVVSVTTFHNLKIDALFAALAEAERVARGGKYILIESYRNEREKVNLLYWQLTCESFYSPEEWQWLMTKAGYTGDYGCIYFE